MEHTDRGTGPIPATFPYYTCQQDMAVLSAHKLNSPLLYLPTGYGRAICTQTQLSTTILANRIWPCYLHTNSTLPYYTCQQDMAVLSAHKLNSPLLYLPTGYGRAICTQTQLSPTILANRIWPCYLHTNSTLPYYTCQQDMAVLSAHKLNFPLLYLPTGYGRAICTQTQLSTTILANRIWPCYLHTNSTFPYYTCQQDMAVLSAHKLNFPLLYLPTGYGRAICTQTQLSTTILANRIWPCYLHTNSTFPYYTCQQDMAVLSAHKLNSPLLYLPTGYGRAICTQTQLSPTILANRIWPCYLHTNSTFPYYTCQQDMAVLSAHKLNFPLLYLPTGYGRAICTQTQLSPTILANRIWPCYLHTNSTFPYYTCNRIWPCYLHTNSTFPYYTCQQDMAVLSAHKLPLLYLPTGYGRAICTQTQLSPTILANRIWPCYLHTNSTFPYYTCQQDMAVLSAHKLNFPTILANRIWPCYLHTNSTFPYYTCNRIWPCYLHTNSTFPYYTCQQDMAVLSAHKLNFPLLYLPTGYGRAICTQTQLSPTILANRIWPCYLHTNSTFPYYTCQQDMAVLSAHKLNSPYYTCQQDMAVLSAHKLNFPLLYLLTGYGRAICTQTQLSPTILANRIWPCYLHTNSTLHYYTCQQDMAVLSAHKLNFPLLYLLTGYGRAICTQTQLSPTILANRIWPCYLHTNSTLHYYTCQQDMAVLSAHKLNFPLLYLPTGYGRAICTQTQLSTTILANRIWPCYLHTNSTFPYYTCQQDMAVLSAHKLNFPLLYLPTGYGRAICTQTLYLPTGYGRAICTQTQLSPTILANRIWPCYLHTNSTFPYYTC